MLKERLLVSFVLLPLGILSVVLGGWYFLAFISVFLLIAGWEYSKMMEKCGHRVFMPWVVATIFVLLVTRQLFGFAHTDLVLGLVILGSITLYLVAYERGQERSATNFAVTLGGVFYIGWVGAYLISLRNLESGMWWLMVSVFPVIIADAGAYFIGRAFGRHRFSRRISPAKTVEGYIGGIVTGTGLITLLSLLFAGWGSPVETWQAAVAGFVISAVAPLGDLAESLFKREAGVKDSSNLIPGHGGFFDRVDSWLWAGIIGFYLVQLMQTIGG